MTELTTAVIEALKVALAIDKKEVRKCIVPVKTAPKGN